MGQPVAVTEKPSQTRPGVVRFETNRNLTGMGHCRYTSAAAAVGTRPSDVLAQRLFATGKVDGVHAYLNVVTVDLAKGQTADGLAEIVESLYTYYVPGFVPPSLEELMGAVAGEAAPAAVASTGEGGLSAAASLIPEHLRERSAKGKAAWLAKMGRA